MRVRKNCQNYGEVSSFFYNDFCSTFDFFEQFQIFGYFAYYVYGAVGLCFSPEDAKGASHGPVC